MIDWGEARRELIARRRIERLPRGCKRLWRAQLEIGDGWGPRTEKHVHYRIAELYAALKGHEQWLHGRESCNDYNSEKYEEIRRIVESMSLYNPKTVIYAAVQVEMTHCPMPVTFRHTFERLMSEGRDQARLGFASQGFSYYFMRAYDAL